MSLFNPENDIDELKRLLIEHRHNGIDSRTLELSEIIDSQGSLAPESEDVVDGTYGLPEALAIANLRTRVSQIETALKNLGILE